MVSQPGTKLKRIVGLTKSDFKLESLHPNAKKLPARQLKRESTADSEGKIFGPPVTESDEESLEQEDKQSAPASRKSSNASTRPPRANGLDTRASSCQRGSQPRELSNPPSITPASHFSSSSRQPTLKKRNSNMMSGDTSDDDQMNVPKRPKKTYNSRRSTVLDTPRKTEKTNKGKVKANSSSLAGKMGGPVFRKVDIEPFISQVDEMEQRKAKNGTFQAPIQLSPSPRAQRASNRLNTQEKNKRNTPNSFKVPKQLLSPESTSTSEEAPQKFVMPLVLPDASPIARIKGSNQSFKKPDTILTTSNMKSLLETAQNKLNLPDMHLPPPTSSITAFSIPSTFNDAASSSSISSPPSSPEIDSLIEGLRFEGTNVPYFREPPTLAKCPLCKEPVDRGFLEAFDRGAHLNIRQQLRFCKAHQARTAESEWEAKGYPKIDWQHFDKRLAWFHGNLDEILQGKRQSFYRNAFEGRLKSGQNRTLQQTMMSGSSMEGLIPGYYGSRGTKLMMENIMTHFAPKLRYLAASDKLLSSGGVSSYVQAVLAPELAVMLVMEDMGTDEEGARAVLRDSVNIGNLLNEEEDEEIKDPEQEEVEEV